MMFTNVKTGLKDTYLTASVSRCCSGLTLFLGGATLFLQRCCTEKHCGGTCVFGCLRLRVRLLERAFFGHVRPHRWNVHVPAAHVLKNFEHPAPSQFSMRHGCARFHFSELSESCTFQEHIPEASGRCNNSTFSLLIAGSVLFELLIFSIFHTLSLKNYIYTVSNSPILQNLSSSTDCMEKSFSSTFSSEVRLRRWIVWE